MLEIPSVQQGRIYFTQVTHVDVLIRRRGIRVLFSEQEWNLNLYYPDLRLFKRQYDRGRESWLERSSKQCLGL